MKIAVIDHILNPGGGTRVARSLLPAMKKLRPDLEITFFANEHGIKRDNLKEVLDQNNIKVIHLRSVKFSGKDLLGLRGSRHVVSLMQRKLGKLNALLPLQISGALQRELESVVKGFDFAFFTWPFHLHCPRLSCPMAGIFHDFNYKYYFSASTILDSIEKFLNDNMPIWLANSTPIVSTQFMKSEIKKFYPQFADKVKVVEIAPMSEISNLDMDQARKIVSKMGIPRNYILCPTQMTGHKNVGPLISAHALLRKRGYQGGLVFTGSGTEGINGRSCEIGVERTLECQDVYGLGYVSNEQVDALIQCADVLANPSLYEGGCGPGFDAWARGVPVAMSNIPTFLEHIQAHDVRAEIFDPRSPQDIADKIDRILSSPEKTAKDVEHSRKAISRFTWELSAQGYLNVFEEVLLNLASR
ncbi:MAG: glycosyltransferase [Verrucomicrobia bacterium]|nr:glycosyltransferase [Verrucomicrobiota bacterium]